jgi:hypothetical protein
MMPPAHRDRDDPAQPIEAEGRFLNLLAPSRPWTCSLHETSLAAGERCQACLDEHAARSLTANDE